MPTLETSSQFCSDATDISSYFSSFSANPTSMMALDNVSDMNFQFQSFDCVPEHEPNAPKTLNNELPCWSTAQPIGEPKPQKNFMFLQVEKDEKTLSRSAPTPTFSVPTPKIDLSTPPDLEIPSYRREVSFVGQAQGFDLFSPNDWEDEQLPTMVEDDMNVPFKFDQHDQVPPTSNGLNFDDYRVGVTSSNPLGAIPMSRPVNVTAQFQSLGFGSPFHPSVKQEESPPPISLPEITVKKEVQSLEVVSDDSDPLSKCFRFTVASNDENDSDNIPSEHDSEMSSWEFDFPGLDDESEAAEPDIPSSPIPSDDDKITIGSYTKAERKRKILRYREKKANRSFTKKIMYKCRKQFADNRPRVGGRFVPMKNKATKEPHKKKEPKKESDPVT